MQFHTHLQDHLDILIQESQSNREQLSDCCNIFQQRALIEESYAKSLEKLTLIKKHNSNHLTHLQSILFKDILIDVEEHKSNTNFLIVFAIQLSENREILIRLTQSQTQHVKKLFEEAKSLVNQVRGRQDLIDKMQAEFTKKQIDYNQKLIIQLSQKYVSEIQVEKKNQQTIKRDELFRNLLELENKIRKSIEECSSYQEGYQLRMTSILRQLQEQDTERAQTLKNRLIDLIRKNDLKAELDAVDIILYQQEFIYTHANDKTVVIHKQFIPDSGLTCECLFMQTENLTEILQDRCVMHNIVENDDYESIQLLKSQDYVEKLREPLDQQTLIAHAIGACQQLMRIQMQQLWIGEEFDIDMLCNAMYHCKIARFIWTIHLQSFRLSNQFEVQEVAYDNICNLIQRVLQIANDEYDVYTIRKIILMSLTFYKKNKIYLHDAFDSNPIFKSQELWDMIFFESLLEEIKSKEPNKGVEGINQSIEREKNTVFGFIGSLAHQMRIYQQDKNDIRTLINKYAKLYLLPDSQMKILYSILDQ